MKKIQRNILALASLLMAGAGLTACSESSDVTEESTVETPASAKTYIMTVTASKGGNTGVTRALTEVVTENGSMLNATWTEGDRVLVYKKGNTTLSSMLGTLGAINLSEDGTSCTFSGPLNATIVNGRIESGDELVLRYHDPQTLEVAFPSIEQDGTLETLANHFDFAEATVTVSVETIDNDVNISSESPAVFENKRAIVKFSLKDEKDEPVNTTKFEVTTGANEVTTVTPSEAINQLYVALPPSEESISLKVTIDGVEYTINGKTGDGFEAGKFYTVSVMIVKSNPSNNVIRVISSGTDINFSYGGGSSTVVPRSRETK